MRKARKDTSTSYSEKHYAMKLDLLTNTTVVDDAIRFVEKKSRQRHTTDASTPVEELEEHMKKIQGDDQQMSTINQIF
jgi:hypothetical protein